MFGDKKAVMNQTSSKQFGDKLEVAGNLMDEKMTRMGTSNFEYTSKRTNDNTSMIGFGHVETNLKDNSGLK